MSLALGAKNWDFFRCFFSGRTLHNTKGHFSEWPVLDYLQFVKHIYFNGASTALLKSLENIASTLSTFNPPTTALASARPLGLMGVLLPLQPPRSVPCCLAMPYNNKLHGAPQAGISGAPSCSGPKPNKNPAREIAASGINVSAVEKKLT
jgi:hypothetical protein